MSSGNQVSIGEVADINPTFKSAKVSPDELVDFLPMAAVEEGESVAQAADVRPLAEVQKGYTNFNDGDILLAKITPCFENGKIAQIRLRHRHGFGSTEFHVLRPHVDKLDGRYLVHFLRRDQVRIDGERKMTGSAGQRRVPKHFLESLKIPLPPLSEQRRIAAILDQADALRAKRREALAQLDNLTQSIFIEMFGNPLHGKSKAPQVFFEDITTRITYGFTSPMTHIDSGIPILTAKNVRNGSLDLVNVHYADQSEFDALTSKSKPKVGDILITKDGTIGRTAVVDTNETICINQSVALVQLQGEKVKPSYVAAYLRTNAVQQVMKNMGKGNALAHLQITELAKLPIGLPPLSQQQQFSVRIEAVNAIAQKSEESEAQLNSLFTSLQHRAFRGEL